MFQFREGKEIKVNNHTLESWERFGMSQSGYFRGKTCLLLGLSRYRLIGKGGDSNIVKINLQFCFCLLIDLLKTCWLVHRKVIPFALLLITPLNDMLIALSDVVSFA